MTRHLMLLMLFASAPPDWPQWRGPDRDGVGPALSPPRAWPKQLRPAWKATVGLGHASPVADAARAYVFAREGEQEVASAYELASGKQVWRQGYPAPYAMNSAAGSHGKGPKATPVLAGGRLYALGISGTLSCFEAGSGRVLWRHDFRGQFRASSPLYGAAMSPLVEGGLVIAHVGGQDDGALTAFDATSGAVRWSWKGDGPGYASPVIATLAGVRQVVTQTQKQLVGVSFEKGELLWSLPFTTAYDQNAVTPVIHGDSVIYSGIDNGIHAIRIVKRAGGFAAESVWHNTELSSYMSSPVRDGDRIYGLSHKRKGQFFCLDARSGKTLWQSEGRQAENAALVLAGGALLALTTDSELLVLKTGTEAFAPLATYSVAASPTWAHPAVTRAGILVKDAETLALWRLE